MVARVIDSDAHLEPCPFCGGSELHIETDSEQTSTVQVECDTIGCEASGPHGKDADEAVVLWNKRASDAQA